MSRKYAFFFFIPVWCAKLFVIFHLHHCHGLLTLLPAPHSVFPLVPSSQGRQNKLSRMYPSSALFSTFHVFSTSVNPGAPAACLGPLVTSARLSLVICQPRSFTATSASPRWHALTASHTFACAAYPHCHQWHHSLLSAWQMLILQIAFRYYCPRDTFTNFSQIKLIISTAHHLGLNFHCFGLLKLFLFNCP